MACNLLYENLTTKRYAKYPIQIVRGEIICQNQTKLQSNEIYSFKVQDSYCTTQ